MERPEHLYHASANRHITEFEPRAEHVRDPLEGPLVFATPDKALASCFMAETNGSWVHIGRYGDSIIRFVCNDEQRFREGDKGGAIYTLPPDSFTTDTTKGMKDLEWTSPTPVVPTSKEEFDTGLQAMQDNGVVVYFIDQPTFDAMTASDDHGWSILLGLTPLPTTLR